MFSNKDTKHYFYNFCFFSAVLFVLVCDAFYISRKEGYHMDEILSYELSNSEFTPWITPTQPEGRLEKYYSSKIYDKNIAVRIANLFDQITDVVKNRGASEAASMTADVYESPVWMSRESIVRYVTYDSKDSVPVLSPYYNSTTDNHPPLYFILLNLFSAVHNMVSPGTLSVWTGCVLNMIFMALSLLMIMLIFDHILEKKFTGIFAALFYGMSQAGLSTVLLIRMYSMTAFFCLAFTYLLFKKIKDGADMKKGNKLLILVTVLGFLTQYFVCIYYFFLVLCAVIYLAISKQKKRMLYLIRALLISAVWGVCLYPFVFHDLFGTKVGESVMGNLGSAGGFFSKFLAFYRIVSDEIIGSAIGMTVVLVLAIICLLISFKKRSVTYPAAFMGVSSLLYVAVVSRIAPYLVDRYVMPVFPVIIICIVFTVQRIMVHVADRFIENDKKKKNIYTAFYAALFIILAVSSFLQRPGYLYSGYDTQRSISKRYSGIDAVVVYDGTSFYQNVPELMNYGNCLLLKEDELGQEYDRLSGDNEVILIIGDGVDEKAALSGIGSNYGFTSITVLLEKGTFGDTVCLLSK